MKALNKDTEGASASLKAAQWVRACQFHGQRPLDVVLLGGPGRIWHHQSVRRGHHSACYHTCQDTRYMAPM